MLPFKKTLCTFHITSTIYANLLNIQKTVQPANSAALASRNRSACQTNNLYTGGNKPKSTHHAIKQNFEQFSKEVCK